MKLPANRAGLPGTYFYISSQIFLAQINQKLTECLYNKNTALVSCIWFFEQNAQKNAATGGGKL
jgi:hypothetical protein